MLCQFAPLEYVASPSADPESLPVFMICDGSRSSAACQLAGLFKRCVRLLNAEPELELELEPEPEPLPGTYKKYISFVNGSGCGS